MSNSSILLDALGSLFNGIILKEKTKFSKELTFEKYTNLSFSIGKLKEESKSEPIKINYQSLKDHHCDNPIHIFLNSQRGMITISCCISETIEMIKIRFSKVVDIPPEDQMILFNSSELKNYRTLKEYKIRDKCKLDVVIDNTDVVGGGFEEYHLPEHFFEPKYDYDFTNINDNGKKFLRGGLEYKRPCGWKRYALKVDDKYENILWLGQTGKSNNDSEWANSYHGTKIYCAESICKNGLKPGTRNSYGVGVYCTPNISTAEKYSETFESPITKKKYKIVFQNRVRPSAIVRCGDKGGPDDYWYIPDQKDIRPYSICIKEIK